MSWMRNMLLGEMGNRLDVAEAEGDIERQRRANERAGQALRSKESEMTMMRNELGRQKLAIQALTLFLIDKGVVEAGELEEFITRIDAEDGVVDGKMELESTKRRLIVPE